MGLVRWIKMAIKKVNTFKEIFDVIQALGDILKFAEERLDKVELTDDKKAK